MDVMELLASRRTYRRFTQQPVPDDVIADMVEAVRLSSCGANRQAIRLVVVRSPEMVAAVQPLVKWAAYLPPEQGAPKENERPTLFAAVVQDTSIPGDKDTDAGIALANLTLAAWAKGVGSCIMGAIDRPRLTELLGLAPWHLLRSTPLPVHQLTHQRLHACIYRIETPTLTPAAAAIAVRTSTLGDYAVPRLLERYLTSPEAIL